MFLGAGASKAADLPLTEELLDKIYPRRGQAAWHAIRTTRNWKTSLESAIRVLYPDGGAPGFRPNVSEFFTALEAVARVHEDRKRLPLDASSLLQALRNEIATGLTTAVRATALATTPHACWLKQQAHPDVIVTSNWDTLAEETAAAQGLEVRHRWPVDKSNRRVNSLASGAVVILKLHGSTDWGLYRDRKVTTTPLADHYAGIATQRGSRTAFSRATKPADLLLRFLGAHSRTPSLDLGFDPPLMATMAIGKAAAIDALEDIWDDAYWCLSRASQLDIVGYSFPPDDLELRILLRTTTRQPGSADLDPSIDLTVQDPSPQAHARARSFLGSSIHSDYRGAGN